MICRIRLNALDRSDWSQRCFRSGVSLFSLASILLLLIVAAAVNAVAQTPHDTKGTEFWVAFMQNNGSGGDFERSDLRLYVSSDTITTVRLHYTPIDDTLVLQITQPNVPFEINISEIFGNDVELSEVFTDGSNAISRKSLHITSNHDITLYGVNIRVMSGDAFLGLPDDVLTGRYIITAWPNGYLNSNDYDMHSEFAVVGTEDGTTLRITPSTILNGRNSTQTFTVGLNKGQVYFGQAQTGLPNDVTGTEIRANKPVAVYSGNQRTSIPTNVGNFRDHLVEQMPPIDAWGSTAILTPHYNITPRSIYKAQARILAAFDNTDVRVTTDQKTILYSLNAGQVLQLDPLSAAYVQATQPILVAQYEHSVGEYMNNSPDVPGGLAELGDPFMMLIPSPEQYDTAYAFQSVNHEEFLVHYINVILPYGAEASLELDGKRITGQTFATIPGTPYSYAQIRVLAGSHYIRADREFGLCVYGFGRANSYGYPGGTLFRTLVTDFERPEISDVRQCELLEGLVTDSHLTDSGIDSCYATPAGRNVDVQVQPFAVGADTVRWNAMLRDPYQDGIVEIKAVDAAGRSTVHRTTIPGFTVAATQMSGGALASEEVVSYNGKKACRDLLLNNYGAFPQTITRVLVTPDTLTGFNLQSVLPLTLMPGESRKISICYSGMLEQSLTLNLEIGSDCIDRTIALVKVISVVDTLPPSQLERNDPCGAAQVTFSEPDESYLMIESITIDTLINGGYTTSPAQEYLPVQTMSLYLTPKDFREDMIYQATVTDRAGNSLVVRDTIGGFTMAVRDDTLGDRLAIRLDRDWTSDTVALNAMRCDSLVLANYGAHRLNVAQILMTGNSTFSIPPAQLPVVLEPGEVRRFAVCLEGRVAGEQIDTLLILDECGRWETVLLRTPVEPSIGHGFDLCGSSITVQSYGAAKSTFLTFPAPNPVSGGEVFVDLGLQQDEMVTMRLLDLSGEEVLQVLHRVPLAAGLHRITFYPERIESGLYFCRMETLSGKILSQKLIIRQ